MKFNKFYYKPLPDYLTIKSSSIEGLGIFATKKIKSNTDLGMTHIKVPIIAGYIRTPLGGFVNHSKDFNCCLIETLDWDDYRAYNLIAIKDIKKNEEITLNYHIEEESDA
jgi:SET domain-containing protein